jgi:hypothetical protein
MYIDRRRYSSFLAPSHIFANKVIRHVKIGFICPLQVGLEQIKTSAEIRPSGDVTKDKDHNIKYK